MQTVTAAPTITAAPEPTENETTVSTVTGVPAAVEVVPGTTGESEPTVNQRQDFADVVLFFDPLPWITENELMAVFDYNGNGGIDFADVVWLCNNL